MPSYENMSEIRDSVVQMVEGVRCVCKAGGWGPCSCCLHVVEQDTGPQIVRQCSVWCPIIVIEYPEISIILQTSDVCD